MVIIIDRLKITIGLNIKKLRLKHNETIAELAGKLGVAYSTVSDWENGKKMPRSSAIQCLSDHYNVSTSDIISEPTKEISEKDIIDLEALLISGARLVYGNKILDAREKIMIGKIIKSVIEE